MSQQYSDPKRETDPYALPDVEVFYMSQADIDQVCRDNGIDPDDRQDDDSVVYSDPGWYYWSCFPGCLPDGEPTGPFATEAEAEADMRENMDVENDDA
jgi:hypothetical protein